MCQTYNKNTASLGESEGIPPPPRNIFNLRALRLHFIPILTQISVDKEDLQFVITLYLALYKILLLVSKMGGGLVLGGILRHPPPLNEALQSRKRVKGSPAIQQGSCMSNPSSESHKKLVMKANYCCPLPGNCLGY